MNIEQIKEELEPTLQSVIADIEDYKSQRMHFKEGKYMQIILSALKTILGKPKENPIMKYEQAIDYYFSKEGLERVAEKYTLILQLQDYIIQRTSLPFIFDKYTVLKILQMTITTYSMILEDCYTGTNARDEDICNIFIDIDTMLLSDRNASAENGSKNAKAVDTINRYETKYGGYGVQQVNKTSNGDKKIVLISPEQTEKLLHNYSFSNIAIEEETKKKTKK